MRLRYSWGGRHPSGYTSLSHAGKLTPTQETWLHAQLHGVFSESLYSPIVAKWSGKSPWKAFTAYWVISKLLAGIGGLPQPGSNLPLQPKLPLTLYTAATRDKSCSCLFAVVHAAPSSWCLSSILSFWNPTSFSEMQMLPPPLFPPHFSRVISHPYITYITSIYPVLNWFLYVHLFSFFN